MDGRADIMVGDRLGQIERIVFEIDKYNGFLFSDVGAFAHGLTSADVDYSGKLDLFTISFDGNVRLFYSREGGLVTEPLVIGNVKDSFGITSGDYDDDNDIDLIVGSDNGNVTMLMNSLRIAKSSTPMPSPPRRNVEVETKIENPWAREMTDLNLTEFWYDNVSFVKGGYVICLDFFCEERFYADIFFFDTPRDNSTVRNAYFLQFPSTVCVQRQRWPFFSSFPQGGCEFAVHNANTGLGARSFNVSNVLKIFDNLETMNLRERFKFRYKLLPESDTNITAITDINYTLLGDFNTPNTNFLLSDDVSNTNDDVANSKNINPEKIKNDRDFTNNFVIVADFTPISIEFLGFSFPPVPGEHRDRGRARRGFPRRATGRT
jgi:hypothetical protein